MLRIVGGSVNAEVILDLADEVEIAATITHRVVADLDLTPIRSAVVLVKASHVILAVD